MKDTQSGIDTVMGAVLAGGSSRRMGRDKALMELDGRTMLARAVAILGSVLEDVLVVAPRIREYTEVEAEIQADLRPGLGPVGGIHTALVRASGRPVFVLACDMPLVSEELVRWIVGMAAEDLGREPEIGDEARPWARIARHQGRKQPLCGLYGGGCLQVVEAALEAGRLSAVDLLGCLETDCLDLDPTADWFHPHLLANVNKPQDLAKLAPQLRQSP